jgi:hypothetical protein
MTKRAVSIAPLCVALLLTAQAHAEPPAERPAPAGDGATIAASTRTAAHRVQDAPTVVVHVPPGFDPRPPLHLVVFLHGYRGCARVLAERGRVRCKPDVASDPEREGWDLAGHHDQAGTNTLLVIPQLAFMRRDGRPGCFARRGCFRRFLEELLGETLAPALGGPRSFADIGSLTLVAHSAGYQAALAILEQGQVSDRVHTVVLMDALYGYSARYARWLTERAPAQCRLVSFYLGRGKTYRESRALFAQVRRKLGERSARQRVTLARAHAAHALIPAAHLAPVLSGLPLPRR